MRSIAALSAVTVQALVLALHGQPQPALQLAAAIAPGGACYALLLRLLAPIQYAEALQLVRRFLRRQGRESAQCEPHHNIARCPAAGAHA